MNWAVLPTFLWFTSHCFSFSRNSSSELPSASSFNREFGVVDFLLAQVLLPFSRKAVPLWRHPCVARSTEVMPKGGFVFGGKRTTAAPNSLQHWVSLIAGTARKPRVWVRLLVQAQNNLVLLSVLWFRSVRGSLRFLHKPSVTSSEYVYNYFHSNAVEKD